MPFGFGGLLSGISKFGSTIGGVVKRGITKLGDLQDGLDAESGSILPTRNRPITGGFAGNEGVPTFDPSRISRIADIPGSKSNLSVIDAESPRMPTPAFDIRPPVRMDQPTGGHPPLTGFDPQSGRLVDDNLTIRDSVTIRPEPEPRFAPMAGAAPMLDRAPVPPVRQESRRDVPIPSLPGRGNEPTPWNPHDEAKYDYVMKGAKRGEDGGLDPRGGFNRNWKTSLQSALGGAAQAYQANPQGGIGAMLGGALGGGLGATFNPQAGRERVFDAGPGRAMLEGQGRQAQRQAQQSAQEKAYQENRRREADTNNINSQIEDRRKPKRTTVSPGQAVLEGDREIYKNPALPQRSLAPAWKQTRTGEWFDANDPKNAELLRLGAPPMTAQERLMNVSPGSAVFDPATRQPVFSNPIRERTGAANIPTEAKSEYTRIQRLKEKADRLFTQAQKEGNETVLQQAYAALGDYNANLKDFGDVFGDYYETGMGDKNWGYVKPKSRPLSNGNQTQAAQQKAAVSPDFINFVATKLGVTPEEARQRIEAGGYSVR